MPDAPYNLDCGHDEVLVAVATKGDGAISQHFGHAQAFPVYAVGPAGARLVGVRTVEHYCQGGFGAEDKWDLILRALADCAAVFVARLGDGPRAKLTGAGIEPVDSYPFEAIEPSISEWFGANRDQRPSR
ncbi:NifB/NifX family molybdenum-iron cluster-binding protein [uncultured Thiodictyon sp.]|uniref:NifB/NifX family molybdenum-iron cluster-binding protein n=1 Tax=uncultured Thiodictyon sp. TaxID=1846217 RepID=UPI0025E15D57|nr:NifB/NifX family molybdenum-iron cluster-binding protein [uncultured Thiodictyon sp.]